MEKMDFTLRHISQLCDDDQAAVRNYVQRTVRELFRFSHYYKQALWVNDLPSLKQAVSQIKTTLVVLQVQQLSAIMAEHQFKLDQFELAAEERKEMAREMHRACTELVKQLKEANKNPTKYMG